VKKLLAVATVIFLIWWAVEQPVTAAHAFHHLGQWIAGLDRKPH